MENKESKKVCIKNCLCYYFEDIIKLKDFNLDNILIEEKSHKTILICDISYKTLIGSKPLLNKLELQGFMMELDIEHCLALKNMMLFMTELHIL